MSKEQEENVVTLRIPAGVYAVLVAEMGFCASIATRADMEHSQENAVMLHRLLLEQGGVKVGK